MSGEDRENDNQGLFHSHNPKKGLNELVGPAHILLVDFMVTEKYIGKIIKDLNLPAINFDSMKKTLKNIQSDLLSLKEAIKSNDSQKIEKIQHFQKQINNNLQLVLTTASKYISDLDTAAKDKDNLERAPLILGAINSIETHMKLLQRDVEKAFMKIENKPAQPKARL